MTANRDFCRLAALLMLAGLVSGCGSDVLDSSDDYQCAVVMHIILNEPANKHFTEEDVLVFRAVRYHFGQDTVAQDLSRYDEVSEMIIDNQSELPGLAQRCFARAMASSEFRDLPPVRDAIATRRDELDQRLNLW